MSRSRSWCYTINNYTDEQEEYLRRLEVHYLIFGREKGESGTSHLQGFVMFSNAKSFTAVKKILPSAHIETTRGRADQAAEYCKKEGDYEEFGTAPVSPKRKGEMEIERYEEAWQLAKQGRFEEVPADIRIRHFSTMKKIRDDYMSVAEPLATLENEWHWGPSGTGKSRGLFTKWPGAYYKDDTKWWDHYAGEETVIIEDLDLSHSWILRSLKIWGDHYPYPVQVKGSTLPKIRPKRIIVTSNHRIEEIFSGADIGPMLRRFKVVEYK